MKPLLATIFLAGVTATFVYRAPANTVFYWSKYEHGSMTEQVPGVSCPPDAVCRENMIIRDDTKYCPVWVDPRLWWDSRCTGGLPPQLPVPEGLR